MISQDDFTKLVKDYNEDYILLLTRASRRHYECLISAFIVLKDLYNVIQLIFDSGGYAYDVLPYPYSFRADNVLLTQLGFSDAEIANIYGFLYYVKESQGMEFEACIEAGSAIMCARAI